MSTVDDSYPSENAALAALAIGEDVRCRCGVLLVRIDGRWEHEGDERLHVCWEPGPLVVTPVPDVDQVYRDGYATGKMHAGDIGVALDAVGQAWDDAAALDCIAAMLARPDAWHGLTVATVRHAVEQTGRPTT